MGLCSQFRRTWRPGYGPDVIDPNKAFDFEQRVILLKKVGVIVILVALLVGLIYLAAASFGGSNHDGTINDSDDRHIKTGAFGSLLGGLSGEDETITISGLTNSSLTIPESEDSETKIVITTMNTSLANSATSDIQPIVSVSDGQKQNNSAGLSCSPGGKVLDCVGLSKAFKTVTTFSNSTRNRTGSVEGYVMLKMTSNSWHPYCRSRWTLDMGYKLCQGLGFQKLLSLQTIDIKELKERISHKLGKDVSLYTPNPSQLPQDVLVLSSEESLRPLRSSSSRFSCEAGYLSCKTGSI